MKQTAVEWLVANIDWQLLKNTKMHYKMIVEQAKEMEKEQIKDAYLKNHLQGCWMEKSAEEFAEQYYNETFKSE